MKFTRFRITGTKIRSFFRNRYPLVVCVTASSFLLLAIVAMQSYRHAIFGTRLLLGWDSPAYVWSAQDVVRAGPLHMIGLWNYPHLYVQLLAFVGYLAGDIITIERILPLSFGFLLIWANYEVVYSLSKRAYVAGLAAFLTVFSLNTIRLLADLNRNLMAFALSTILFLLVPDLEKGHSLLNKKYLLVLLTLSIVAMTHFETYFVLVLSLVLYGCLAKNPKDALKLLLACLVPVLVLTLLFPSYFLGYATTAGSIYPKRELMLIEILPWMGGSWVGVGFLIAGAFYSLYMAVKRSSKCALMIFSYFSAISLLVVLIEITSVFAADFAFRALLILPGPVLLTLAIIAIVDLLKDLSLEIKVFSAKRKNSISLSVRRLLVLIAMSSLLASSVIVAFEHTNDFLTPYIPQAAYRKMIVACDFLKSSGLSKPVVVYYGTPAVWLVGLIRSYIGLELGEHFTYYGDFEDLLSLVPSEPKFKDDPYLKEMEECYVVLYYSELTGNWSGSIPFTFSHEEYIQRSEILASHPILIITPEFYSEKIPYYVKSFHLGEGIYLIPPHSLLKTGEIVYGPPVLVHRDGFAEYIRSEYLYADPNDPSLTILQVNGSSGYTSYNFTQIPLGWKFLRIEQSGDLSFPEKDPRRFNGTKASTNNDPADTLEGWTTLQSGSINLNQTSKKEGVACLRIVGVADSWGNLGARYNPEGVWDLSKQPLLGLWVKVNEETAFSIALVDAAGGSRTFWAIQEYSSSATTEWKRFVIDLNNYTSQTANFDITRVDLADFYVYSDPGKEMALWIDDLMVDGLPHLDETIYKARVLVEDTMTVYFAVREMP